MKSTPHKIIEGAECKYCVKCQSWLPLSTYYKAKYIKDGYSRLCKVCSCKYTRDRRIPEKSKISYGKWRIKNKYRWDKIIEELGYGKCKICGYDKCFAAIDFHHVSPKEKEMQVARIFDKVPTEERVSELLKCIPVCSNCHRELHNGR
jgi:hypothetical protein